ncbi:hypothetical protein HZB88_02890 [archaeon]|nr:hypothetical protein [archaeon]
MINRNGQAEIIGFMVVIVLLIFIGIIYLRFALKEEPSILEETQESLEANKMASALRYYTVCEGMQMSKVLEACKNNGFACGQDACELAETQIKGIISAYGWKSYSLSIGETLLIDCEGNKMIGRYEDSKIKFSIGKCF